MNSEEKKIENKKVNKVKNVFGTYYILLVVGLYYAISLLNSTIATFLADVFLPILCAFVIVNLCSKTLNENITSENMATIKKWIRGIFLGLVLLDIFFNISALRVYPLATLLIIVGNIFPYLYFVKSIEKAAK